jgi:methylenetetrahydrofolate dehydrogenase (NADP+)/methenyltetrahydrofolate cyclohydrolase
VTARIIDGKAVAAAARARAARFAAEFQQGTGRPPGLATVLVGEDPASAVYVRSKTKATGEAGMAGFAHHLPVSTPEQDLLDLVEQLNRDDVVDGILVQLPLPSHMDSARVIAALDPAKDVDGFHPVNAGRLATGLDALIPCTPLGCLHLLKQEVDQIAGKEAVVIGRSNIVGRPMAQLLVGESATVTIAHSKTRDLPEVVRRADIVVAAVGRPQMVKGDWIKAGSIVIDVGVNRVPAQEGKSRLVGDVDFEPARARAAAITPVPGGVGPMTIAMLIRNTVLAAYRRAGMADPEEL